MNSVMVQHQISNLRHQERLQDADRFHALHQDKDENSFNLIQSVAEKLVNFGEKLQESAPASWSLSQPERHLVK